MFLLRENDCSKNKTLSKLEGEIIDKSIEDYYIINSKEVKNINEILLTITEQQIEYAYSVENMDMKEVYKSGWITKEKYWDYILNHVLTIKNAFLKASENNNFIIVHKS